MKLIYLIFCVGFIKQINASPIYGGNQVKKPKKFRFVASLQVLGKHICGGSILNHRWILTAAHCLTHTFLSEEDALAYLQVRVGTILRKPQNELYSIDWIRVHPGYTNFEFNDLALLHVNQTISFNEFVTFIRLPIQDITHENDVVKIAGWGVVTKTGEFPRVLQEIRVSVYNYEWCKKKFKLQGWHICTINPKFKGPCSGDSGGPVIDSSDKFVVGVVSFGMFECGSSPGAFHTKVWDYVEWINYFLTHWSEN